MILNVQEAAASRATTRYGSSLRDGPDKCLRGSPPPAPPPCNRITPPTPNSNRNPVSALYKIRTHSTPSKGAFFPSNQCKIAVHSAPHQLSVGGWCGDYNANFSIVGRVVLLHVGVYRLLSRGLFKLKVP